MNNYYDDRIELSREATLQLFNNLKGGKTDSLSNKYIDDISENINITFNGDCIIADISDLQEVINYSIMDKIKVTKNSHDYFNSQSQENIALSYSQDSMLFESRYLIDNENEYLVRRKMERFNVYNCHENSLPAA